MFQDCFPDSVRGALVLSKTIQGKTKHRPNNLHALALMTGMTEFLAIKIDSTSLLKPTMLLQTRPGRQIDDFPYSAILARQDDFYYQGFTDWCATRDSTLPRRDGSTSEERSLASWFRHKLHLYYSDDLSDEELVKLRKIPAIDEHICLHGQWSLKFALKSMSFEDWCAKHRKLLPQQAGGTAEERSLADWLKNAISRNRHGHNGKHSENKLPDLWKIPVSVDLDVFSVKNRSLSLSERFDIKWKSFEDWCAQHSGSLPKRSGDTHEESSLAMWLMNKLFRYRCGKLSDDQLAQLRKIPAISEVFSTQGKSFRSQHFVLKCKSFKDWCAAHNGTLPKRNGDTQEEKSLAVWLMQLLFRYRRGKLSDYQLAQLRKIPAISEVFSVQGKSFRSQHFVRSCKSFEDWCAQHGGSLPKQKGDTQEERSLAKWFKNMLFRHRRGSLSDDQLAQLRDLPVISEVLNYKGFADWCATHDGTFPRKDGPTSDERSLACWFRHKLRLYRSGELSDEELVKLKKIPAIREFFCLQGRFLSFSLKCKSFEDWCAQHGGSLPKRSGDTQEERSLADWFINKLFRYRRGKLSDDQLTRLRKIPAIFDLFSTKDRPPSLSERFELKCKSFEDWCASQGTLPKRNGDSREERSLAHWFRNKLSSYRRGKLPDDQLTILRMIPGVSKRLENGVS